MSAATAGSVPDRQKLTVYVPCDVAAVRVRLGYQETLTPIEQVVLKAVHAGADTLGGLCDALGLSRRVAVDLVQDLWHTGYLRLIKSYSGLEVTSKVREHLEAGTLERLESAETLVDRRAVMIDRLSGYIMPVQGPSAPAQPKLAVPLENSTVRIADAPIAALLDAIERGLVREEHERSDDPRERGRDGRRRRVLGAYVTDRQVNNRGRRWLPLEIQTAIDPDTDQLVVSVLDHRLPDVHRAEAARQLTKLVASQPKDPFVQALRAQAVPGLLSAPSIGRAVARLRDQAVTAAGIPAGQRGNWHRDLAARYRQLNGLINLRVEREVDARVVVGAAHVPELIRLIKSAHSQLVLASPWVHYDALNAITPALRKALKRGVQVVLLWGKRYHDTLDKSAAGLLYDTTLRTAARTVGAPAAEDVEPDPQTGVEPGARQPWLLVPDTPSRAHAKFAVADDHTALVTSWNLLSQDRPRQEVGLCITAPAPAQAPSSHPIREILRWARSAVPGYEMSRLMLVTERDFALRAPDRPAAAADWLPVLPEVPPPPGEGSDEHAKQAARQWSDNWQYVARKTDEDLAARTHPPAEMVLDGEHRSLLWKALREARHRLVITSDRLSHEVVDERLLDAFDQAAARGVAITIVYGRPHERDRATAADGALLSAPTETEHALNELAERHRPSFRVICNGNNAKALVWDDEAVVTSFNFLSFEGAYSSRAAHRQQSELGLRLTGREATDDIARAVGAAVVERPATEPVVDTRPPDTSFAVAQSILTAVSEGTEVAQAVAETLEGSADPWRVLDRLAENAGRALLRAASAYCVSTHAGTMSRGRRERWLRWLFEDLWADGLFLEAALLRAATDDDGLRPGPAITTLAAGRGLGCYGDVVAEVWDEVVPAAPPAEDEETDVATPTRTEAECTAILVAAMERTVFYGDQDAATMLELGMDTLLPRWRPLATAVRAYAAGSYNRPVPLGLIRSNLDRRSDLAEQARLWARLDQAFERTAQTQLPNLHSIRVLHELFDSDKGSIFARVRSCLKARDLEEIALRLAPDLPTRDQLGPLIDEASRVVDSSKEPVHGEHRKRLVRQLTAIVTDARALAATFAPDVDANLAADVDTAGLADAARLLADVVAAELPELIAAIEAVASPEARFIREVLESFVVLQEWAALHTKPGAISA
jgi:phosphatidylserine/phosphatidylglycerophosphate/cardiolipin synthase-like enzyme